MTSKVSVMWDVIASILHKGKLSPEVTSHEWSPRDLTPGFLAQVKCSCYRVKSASWEEVRKRLGLAFSMYYQSKAGSRGKDHDDLGMAQCLLASFAVA